MLPAEIKTLTIPPRLVPQILPTAALGLGRGPDEGPDVGSRSRQAHVGTRFVSCGRSRCAHVGVGSAGNGARIKAMVARDGGDLNGGGGQGRTARRR